MNRDVKPDREHRSDVMTPRVLIRHKAAADFPFTWQRVKVCPIYNELTVWGEFGFRRNDDADEDDRGGHTAYEVWHWPTNSAESDWFTLIDAIRETRRLYAEMRWPDAR